MHLLSSITGLNSENRDTRLSAVPTGQIVLQYARPRFHARKVITAKVTAAVIARGAPTPSAPNSPAAAWIILP